MTRHHIAVSGARGDRGSMPVAAHRPTRAGAVVLLAYVGAVVLANVASTHWAPLLVGTVGVPAGTLWAGVTLTLRDLLHEALGPRGVTVAIALGAVLSWQLATAHIAAASVLAFTVSELADAAVYARLRTHSHLGAVIGSNTLALGVDSVLFVPLAFGSAAIPGQVLGKTVATALTVGLLVAARAARTVLRR
jgi:uncharacterized PurR-regulated membrane protein YhhQ (DUF165 family)